MEPFLCIHFSLLYSLHADQIIAWVEKPAVQVFSVSWLSVLIIPLNYPVVSHSLTTVPTQSGLQILFKWVTTWYSFMHNVLYRVHNAPVVAHTLNICIIMAYILCNGDNILCFMPSYWHSSTDGCGKFTSIARTEIKVQIHGPYEC